MSTTVDSLYQQVCFALFEDTGLSLGLVTTQQFLDLLGEVLMEFLRETGLERIVYTQRSVANTSQYTYPDKIPEVYQVFVNAKLVDHDDLTSSVFVGNWRAHPGQPRIWHEDGLPLNTLEVAPPPAITGTAGAPAAGTFEPGQYNLTILGSTIASKEVWSLGDTLDTIPDTFTPYLIFMVLERIFSMDGESKDLRRAEYCRARREEGVLLAESILLRMERVDEASARR